MPWRITLLPIASTTDSMSTKSSPAHIALIWDSPTFIEKLFLEYGFDCMRIDPTALGSRYLPQFDTIIIPTGFANPEYTKILTQLNRKKQFFMDFLHNGGNVLVFGAAIDRYDYDFLPCNISYVKQYGQVRLEASGEAGNIITASGEMQECDGYFESFDGDENGVNGVNNVNNDNCKDEDKKKNNSNTVLLNNDGNCVMSVSHHGKGKLVITSLHEYPPRDFIAWLVQ